jgi:hypothetical protein
MSQERKPSYVDLRMAQLAEQRAAQEATIKRSPPPPDWMTPIQMREFLLSKNRLEAAAERKPR